MEISRSEFQSELNTWFCTHETNEYPNVESVFGRSACNLAWGGQALEEAKRIKRERGDEIEIWWQLGYESKVPYNLLLHHSIPIDVTQL